MISLTPLERSSAPFLTAGVSQQLTAAPAGKIAFLVAAASMVSVSGLRVSAPGNLFASIAGMYTFSVVASTTGLVLWQTVVYLPAAAPAAPAPVAFDSGWQRFDYGEVVLDTKDSLSINVAGLGVVGNPTFTGGISGIVLGA
ncbi:MAG: hypothetical protein ACYCVW_16525 [Rhodocyclaceae bacterium]